MRLPDQFTEDYIVYMYDDRTCFQNIEIRYKNISYQRKM